MNCIIYVRGALWSIRKILAYLLLLHELGVGAIIDNIAAKDGSSQDSIDFFGVDVLKLAVEDKVVASRPNSNGGALSEEDKGENVAMLYILLVIESRDKYYRRNIYLFAVLGEESRRIHAISDGAADEREPVENQRRFIGVLEENLASDIEEYGQHNEASEKHQ